MTQKYTLEEIDTFEEIRFSIRQLYAYMNTVKELKNIKEIHALTKDTFNDMFMLEDCVETLYEGKMCTCGHGDNSCNSYQNAAPCKYYDIYGDVK